MSKWLDEFMEFMYSSTLSIMDWVAITLISTAASEVSQWLWVLLLPWIAFSTHQKNKYE